MRIKLKEITHHKLKLNYKIKNKSKIHKKTSNKLKIKKIKTQVKTFINQMITLKFYTSNMNFEGRIEKKEEQKALPATNHTAKKKGFHGANDMVERDFNCNETLCIHQHVHCKR